MSFKLIKVPARGVTSGDSYYVTKDGSKIKITISSETSKKAKFADKHNVQIAIGTEDHAGSFVIKGGTEFTRVMTKLKNGRHEVTFPWIGDLQKTFPKNLNEKGNPIRTKLVVKDADEATVLFHCPKS